MTNANIKIACGFSIEIFNFCITKFRQFVGNLSVSVFLIDSGVNVSQDPFVVSMNHFEKLENKIIDAKQSGKTHK